MTCVIQWKKKPILTSFDCWLKCPLFQHLKIASKVVPRVFFQSDIEKVSKLWEKYPCTILACKANKHRSTKGVSMYLVPLDFSKNLELKILLLSWYLLLLLIANSNIFQHWKQHLPSTLPLANELNREQDNLHRSLRTALNHNTWTAVARAV